MNKFVLDWGNTRVKLGQFEVDRLIKSEIFSNIEDAINTINSVACSTLFYSSVADDSTYLEGKINKRIKVFALDYNTPLPFRNLYVSKNTLGKDRIAAAAGAHYLFPSQAIIIVDAGTCITIDYIDSKGDFQGGIITPGLKIRREGMHHFTKKLPLLASFDVHPALIGKTTAECMSSGIINGAVAELEGLISKLKEDKGESIVLICGGDSKLFESKLKEPIFAVPELVLIGLNAIMKHNEI